MADIQTRVGREKDREKTKFPYNFELIQRAPLGDGEGTRSEELSGGISIPVREKYSARIEGGAYQEYTKQKETKEFCKGLNMGLLWQMLDEDENELSIGIESEVSSSEEVSIDEEEGVLKETTERVGAGVQIYGKLRGLRVKTNAILLMDEDGLERLKIKGAVRYRQRMKDIGWMRQFKRLRQLVLSAEVGHRYTMRLDKEREFNITTLNIDLRYALSDDFTVGGGGVLYVDDRFYRDPAFDKITPSYYIDINFHILDGWQIGAGVFYGEPYYSGQR